MAFPQPQSPAPSPSPKPSPAPSPVFAGDPHTATRTAPPAISRGAAAELAAAVLAEPWRFYASPYQLAWDGKLGRAQRLEALHRWLDGEGAAYRADRRPAHLSRIRDLHHAIRVVEVHDI